MILADYHVHTCFCDGKNSPEEMVLAAIDKGMDAIGFSGHSHTAFDESWCMSEAGTLAYRSEINRLKDAYASQIKVFCGVEQDFYSERPADVYDYIIGSVHYLRVDREYIPVDESAEILRAATVKYFHGDVYALVEAYYLTLTEVQTKTGCDIIGHFDLICKFNEDGKLFDEAHPRYIAAYRACADRLLESGCVFEINTGAIARGYKSVPYPSQEIYTYLLAHGARFILSGDAHSTDGLCYGFSEWEKMLK